MSVKIGMVGLGCSKNQVDAELMLYKIRQAGYEIVDEAEKADYVIVNTCGFVEDAKRESIENILELTALKAEGRLKGVLVTGCLAERYQDQIASEIPEVDSIMGIGANQDIVDILNRTVQGQKVSLFPEKSLLPLSGSRILANQPFFAYLKIAEGCDNHCSYCAIPSIRGGFRSRPMEDILQEAEQLVSKGVRELNVIAQDITRYGQDLYGEYRLAALLRQLCRIDGLRWVRLLYCYPDKITDELIDVIAGEEKIAKYIDMPIQHCSEEVLSRMNRTGGKLAIVDALRRLRERVPGIVLRTTVMVGFPGETREQFSELAEFVRQAEFDRLGCFAFSPEEGTSAAEMDGQIDNDVKQRRSEVIMELQGRIHEKKSKKFVGKTLEVAVEGYDRYIRQYYGRSQYEAPDVDGKIFFSSQAKHNPGDFVTVKIADAIDYDLFGAEAEESL